MSDSTTVKILGALLGSIFALKAGYTYGTADTVKFRVNAKERTTSAPLIGDGSSISSKYLVFTDKETFKNVDSWLKLKFNSSDVQGRLESGSNYTCDVYGWRIPVLSSYRNIVSCSKDKAPQYFRQGT